MVAGWRLIGDLLQVRPNDRLGGVKGLLAGRLSVRIGVSNGLLAGRLSDRLGEVNGLLAELVVPDLKEGMVPTFASIGVTARRVVHLSSVSAFLQVDFS